MVILAVLWARSGPEHAGRTAQLQVAFLAATAATLLWLLIPRAAVVRRRSEAILLGRKAEAFKRFLTDFPRFKDAVAAKVELWEELLVWGVALGVAEHVIEAAKGMPIEILQASPIMANPPGIYFYGGGFGGFTPPPPPPPSSSSRAPAAVASAGAVSAAAAEAPGSRRHRLDSRLRAPRTAARPRSRARARPAPSG